jgi:hypothetical protein
MLSTTRDLIACRGPRAPGPVVWGLEPGDMKKDDQQDVVGHEVHLQHSPGPVECVVEGLPGSLRPVMVQ